MYYKDKNLELYLNSSSNNDCSIYFYETNESTKKNTVTLNKNVLCLVIEGKKEIQTNDCYISIDNTTFFILKSGNCIMSEKTTVNRNYKSILFLFSDNFIIKLLNNKHSQDTTYYNNLYPIVAIKKDSYVFNFQKSLQLLENLIYENNTIVEIKLKEILLYLIDKETSTIHSFIQNIQSNILKNPLENIVNKHLNTNLTITELAFLCNMSISTFKRKFFLAYKTSPRQYFIAKKMEKAIILLQQNKNPSEIYFELGYENLSAFSQQFKKHFGISPKNYFKKM